MSAIGNDEIGRVRFTCLPQTWKPDNDNASLYYAATGTNALVAHAALACLMLEREPSSIFVCSLNFFG